MSNVDPYDSLVPIFHSSDLPKKFQQIGTGILVQLYGELLLLTAAHVTDQLHAGELMVPTAEGFSPIEGYMMHIDLPPEIPRSQDTVDIAYFRITLQLAGLLSHHFRVLPHARAQVITSISELVVCSASGYPASKGKKDGEKYSSEIFSFRGAVAGPDVYQELGLHPEGNIIIQFKRKEARDPETLKPFPTPGLRGISGGGIFAWPPGAELSSDWSLPKLVGIVHTFKEREGLIIGTTLLPLVAALGLGRMKKFGGIA